MNPMHDHHLFKSLLSQVEASYAAKIGTQTPPISEWKGQEIIHFQDDLRAVTGSTVSEKWFYTYVKNEPKKLPRIDILNLLASYCGFDSWSAFAKAQTQQEITNQKEPQHLKSKKTYWIAMVILLLSGIYWFYSFINRETKYEFCFVDFYTRTAIENSPLNIQVLRENESPQYFKTDQQGCFKGTASGTLIKFVVSSPYHKTDTITRIFRENKSEVLPIQTNDYALMLDYYTNGKIEDLQKRRQQLGTLIADDAMIMEVLPYAIGVTLYDKADFIDKITTPTTSLSRMEVITTKYENNRIVQLKFRQNDEK